MSFRGDADAMRARLDVLERELERARDELGRLQGVDAERDQLQRRVAELERALEGRPSKRLATLRAMASPALYVLGGLAATGALGYFLTNSSCFDGPRLPVVAPSNGVVDLDQTPTPSLPPMEAHGTQDAPSGCHGYLSRAPQISLRTRDPVTAFLTTVAQPGDLVMALRLPSGEVICDDDSGVGFNPLLQVALPAGDTAVWIGTYREGDSVPFRLSVIAPADLALPPGSSVTPDAQPLLGVIEGPPAASSSSGVTTPTVVASSISHGCVGRIPAAPHLAIELADSATLRLHARSTTDLVMMMRTGSGLWICDDDSGGNLEPEIVTDLPAGRHLVWVGAYSSDVQVAAFQLEASAFVRPHDPAHLTR